MEPLQLNHLLVWFRERDSILRRLGGVREDPQPVLRGLLPAEERVAILGYAEVVASSSRPVRRLARAQERQFFRL